MELKKDHLEKLLQSIEGIRKLEAPGFFYTRLRARMEREDQQAPVNVFLRPAFLSLCLAIVLTVNVLLLTSSQQVQSPATPRSGIDNFAKEYNLGISDRLYE